VKNGTSFTPRCTKNPRQSSNILCPHVFVQLRRKTQKNGNSNSSQISCKFSLDESYLNFETPVINTCTHNRPPQVAPLEPSPQRTWIYSCHICELVSLRLFLLYSVGCTSTLTEGKEKKSVIQILLHTTWGKCVRITQVLQQR